jgi:hypothetical protein
MRESKSTQEIQVIHLLCRIEIRRIIPLGARVMKQSSDRRITIGRVIPLLASLAAAIPLLAQTAQADLAQCPSPRPKDLSEAQWYACSQADLASADKQMNITALLQGCDNVDCVQAKANQISNTLIANSTWKYGAELQHVQEKLSSIKQSCPDFSRLQDCLQDNNLLDSGTVEKFRDNSYGTLQDIASGKKAQQDKAASDTHSQQMAAARKARALISSTFAGSEKQPENLQSCFVEFQYQLPSSTCVAAHVNAATELLKKSGLQSVADKLTASIKPCRTQECFSDAVDSATSAITNKYPDLDQDPVVAAKSSVTPAPASKKAPMTTAQKIAWYKARNAADRLTLERMAVQYRNLNCAQADTSMTSLHVTFDNTDLNSVLDNLNTISLGAKAAVPPAQPARAPALIENNHLLEDYTGAGFQPQPDSQ